MNNWKIAHAIAAVGGAEFMAILQPVVSVHSPQVDHLPTAELKMTETRPVYKQLRRLVAADPEIDWFDDLSDAYDGDEYIFIDHVHLSENGHDIMAARIKALTDPIFRRSGIVLDRAEDRPPGPNSEPGIL